MAIQSTEPLSVPAATYNVWWIDTIGILNKNIQKPTATIKFRLGDAAGNMAPAEPVVYSIDIMAKITAGDTELAGLFQSIIAKAGAMAIADGKLPATVGA